MTPDHLLMRSIVTRAVAILLVCLTFAMFASCALFAPQQDVAKLCADLPNRNAAVTCVQASYAVVKATADVTRQRHAAGKLSADTARWVAARLEDAFTATEIAEVAISAGRLDEAEDQMAAVIVVLTAIEEKLQ